MGLENGAYEVANHPDRGPEHPQGTEAEGAGAPIISGCVYPKRRFLDYSTEKTRGLGPTGEEAASAVTHSRASAPRLSQ